MVDGPLLYITETALQTITASTVINQAAIRHST